MKMCRSIRKQGEGDDINFCLIVIVVMIIDFLVIGPISGHITLVI